MELLARRRLTALALAVLFLGWGAALAYADRIKIVALPPIERTDVDYLHQVHVLECATQYPSVEWALATLKNFGWRLASEEQAALHLYSSARFRAASGQIGQAESAEAALVAIDNVGALSSYPPQGNRVLFFVDDEEPSMSLKISLSLQEVGQASNVDQICELLVTDKEFVDRFRADLDVNSVPGLSSATSGMISFFKESSLNFKAWSLFPELEVRVRLLDWKRMLGKEPRIGDAYAISLSRHSRPSGQPREN